MSSMMSIRAATSLTTIATRWGFLHIGRFTKDYRRLFHESPKTTLACPFHLDGLGGAGELLGSVKDMTDAGWRRSCSMSDAARHPS